MRLGLPEMLPVIAILVILFGANRLPKLAKSLREAKKEFEKTNVEDDAASSPGASDATERSPEKN